jgi:hypothetical protein
VTIGSIASIRTSKVLLVGWIVVGATVLLTSDLTSNHALIYGLTLVAVVWNRIDSRTKGYRLSLSGPGGVAVKLERPDEEGPTSSGESIEWRADQHARPK